MQLCRERQKFTSSTQVASGEPGSGCQPSSQLGWRGDRPLGRRLPCAGAQSSRARRARQERGRKGGRGPGRPERRRAGGSRGSGEPRGSRYFLQLLRLPRPFLACFSGRRRRLSLLLEVSLMGVWRKVRGAVLPRLASCGTPAIPAPPGRRSAPARTAAAHRAPRTRRRAPAGPGDRRRGGSRGRSSPAQRRKGTPTRRVRSEKERTRQSPALSFRRRGGWGSLTQVR